MGNFPLGSVIRTSNAWTRAVGNIIRDLDLFQIVTTSQPLENRSIRSISISRKDLEKRLKRIYCLACKSSFLSFPCFL